jgi:hypothetical protein
MLDQRLLTICGIAGLFGTASKARQQVRQVRAHPCRWVSPIITIYPTLRDMPAWTESDLRRGGERDANENPRIPYRHRDGNDPVVQNWHVNFNALTIQPPIRNFNGISYPGVGCNCALPTQTARSD